MSEEVKWRLNQAVKFHGKEARVDQLRLTSDRVLVRIQYDNGTYDWVFSDNDDLTPDDD